MIRIPIPSTFRRPKIIGFSNAILFQKNRAFASTTDAPEVEPAVTSRLAAFSARTGIVFENQKELLDAVTHTSYTKKESDISSEQALNFYTTEYVMAKYPLLPAEVCESIVKAYVGVAPLASVGQQFGVQFIMRWKNSTEKSEKVEMGTPMIRSWIIQSLVGALHLNQGPQKTKEFIRNHILSRSIDSEAHLDAFLKMNQPRRMLAYLTKSQNKPTPVARLLKETGRFSVAPVFIVGMYSGLEKIGEGYGSSLKMAETRAVKDALMKHYLVEVRNATVPTDFESEESISFLTPESDAVKSETVNTTTSE
ncbi:hypothetical protein HDV02_000147 [Globomyces sp. JEL0801]|nr:hypothetical protein HDV02_000147 [Globomyces sp. JEL0801]